MTRVEAEAEAVCPSFARRSVTWVCRLPRVACVGGRLAFIVLTVWAGGWSAARLSRFLQGPAAAVRGAQSGRAGIDREVSWAARAPLAVEGGWSVAGLPWRFTLAEARGDNTASQFTGFAGGPAADTSAPAAVDQAGLVRLVTLFGRKNDLGGGEERWTLDRPNFKVGARLRWHGGRRCIAALRIAWPSASGGAWSLIEAIAIARGPDEMCLALGTGPDLPTLPARARVVCIGWDAEARAACAIARFTGGMPELIGSLARDGWEPAIPRPGARPGAEAEGFVCRRAGEAVRIWSRRGPEHPETLIVGMLRLMPDEARVGPGH